MPYPQLPVTELPLQPDLAGYPPPPDIKNLDNGGSYMQAQQFNEPQQRALQQLLQMGGQRLAQPTAGFQPFEERARQQFQTQTIPSLAERFTALGGGQRSAAFQGALGQAGSDLEAQLAQAKSQYGLQNESQALQMLQLGLTPQYNQQYTEPFNSSQALMGLASQGGETIANLLRLAGDTPGVKEKILNLFGLGAGAGTTAAVANRATQAGTAGTTGAAAGTTQQGLSNAQQAAIGAGVGGAAALAPRAVGAIRNLFEASGQSPAQLLAGQATPAKTTLAAAMQLANQSGRAPAAAAAAAPGFLQSIGLPAGTTVGGLASTLGAMGMTAVAAIGMAWWLQQVVPDWFGEQYQKQPHEFANALPEGTWYDQEGRRVVSNGNTVKTYNDQGNVVNEEKFAEPYRGKPAAESTDIQQIYYGQEKPHGTYYRNKPKGV